MSLLQLFFPFLFLVLFVSVTIMYYSSYYMVGELNLQYYIIMMLVFISSMLFLLMSNSLIMMLLSWEGLGVSSFFLILYYNSWEANMNALVTILTMRIGELFLFIWLSNVFLTNMFSSSLLYHSSMYYLVFILFAFTKSAQFPYSGWLPKAMSAPTPTSSLVHSSTLVTAGLMLILSFSEMMPTILMLLLLLGGLFTMVMGSVLTLMESSIKKVVAYSTMSQMGLATMVFGFGNYHLGMLSLVTHGFAKSLLFMQVGYFMHNMINQQNTRLWNGGGSVESLMSVQLICTLYSLCGISFFSGMVTKESMLKLMINSSVMFILLVVLVSCIYVTFMYSVILYKVMLNNSSTSVSYYHGSIIMLLLTYMEVLFVVTYFSWLLMNIISNPISFVFMEGLFPMMMLLTVVLGVPAISNNMFSFFKTNKIMMSASAFQLNSWMTYIIPMKFVEAYLNMLNKVFFMLCLMCSRKLYYSTSLPHMVVLFMLIMLLFS